MYPIPVLNEEIWSSCSHYHHLGIFLTSSWFIFHGNGSLTHTASSQVLLVSSHSGPMICNELVSDISPPPPSKEKPHRLCCPECLQLNWPRCLHSEKQRFTPVKYALGPGQYRKSPFKEYCPKPQFQTLEHRSQATTFYRWATAASVYQLELQEKELRLKIFSLFVKEKCRPLADRLPRCNQQSFPLAEAHWGFLFLRWPAC